MIVMYGQRFRTHDGLNVATCGRQSVDVLAQSGYFVTFLES